MRTLVKNWTIGNAGNLGSTPLWPERVKLSIIFSGQEGRLDGFFRVSFFPFQTSMCDGINRVINVGAWTMDGLYQV